MLQTAGTLDTKRATAAAHRDGSPSSLIQAALSGDEAAVRDDRRPSSNRNGSSGVRGLRRCRSRRGVRAGRLAHRMAAPRVCQGSGTSRGVAGIGRGERGPPADAPASASVHRRDLGRHARAGDRAGPIGIGRRHRSGTGARESRSRGPRDPCPSLCGRPEFVRARSSRRHVRIRAPAPPREAVGAAQNGTPRCVTQRCVSQR